MKDISQNSKKFYVDDIEPCSCIADMLTGKGCVTIENPHFKLPGMRTMDPSNYLKIFKTGQTTLYLVSRDPIPPKVLLRKNTEMPFSHDYAICYKSNPSSEKIVSIYKPFDISTLNNTFKHELPIFIREAGDDDKKLALFDYQVCFMFEILLLSATLDVDLSSLGEITDDVEFMNAFGSLIQRAMHAATKKEIPPIMFNPDTAATFTNVPLFYRDEERSCYVMYDSKEGYLEGRVVRSPIQSVIDTFKELKIPMGKIRRNLPKLEEKYNNFIPGFKFRLKKEKLTKKTPVNVDEDDDEPNMTISFTSKIYMYIMHDPKTKAGEECRTQNRSWLLTTYDEGDGTGVPMDIDRFVGLWGGTRDNYMGSGLHHEVEIIMRYDSEIRYTKLSGCSTSFRVERFSNILQASSSKTIFTIDNEFLRRKQQASIKHNTDIPIRKYASGNDDMNPDDYDDATGA